MPGIIVPKKAVAELARLCDKAGGIVDLALSPAKIAAKFSNGVRLTSKLIDGTFPDYTRVIPTSHTRTVDVDRTALAASIQLVSALAERSNLRLGLDISEGQMKLSVSNPDAGTSSDEIGVELTGAPVEVGMNPKYMLEILGAMSGDKARILIQDPGSPVVMRDIGDEDSVFVVMPLR
jgi:DNA polymerase-3 subunit beta